MTQEFKISRDCAILFTCLLFLVTNGLHSEESLSIVHPEKIDTPLRIGVIGLVHTHVHWILGREKSDDIEIVGIVEPNRELAQQYSLQHGYSMDIVYDNIYEMVNAVNPEAVTAFNTIYGHLEVVEYCAPRGIHVMVEKPLAVNIEHAIRMMELANLYGIQLLTNYETSWYPSHKRAFSLINKEHFIDELRKMIFLTGHPGPIEIGCNPEFLEWLTDPLLNGGGALTDFGCYGANLATWFLEGKTPISVSCVTQQFKPELYPYVDDDATIILTYADCQVVIQASWNWSHNRKETEIYGKTGYIKCQDGIKMEVLEKESEGPYILDPPPITEGYHDPFALFHKVVKQGYKIPDFDPSSLENNMIVMQVLHLAKLSSETGKVIFWEDHYKQG